MKKHSASWLVACLALCTHASFAEDAGPIQDNSFLIEEAYNQEAGVVQHINTLQRTRSGDLMYAFTQEWPAPSITHQLSYTVPFQRIDGSSGIGDVAINYRYQWIGDGDAQFAVSPRLTALLPTGDDRRGLGAGGVGIQVNLPVSYVINSAFVTHWNAGATVTPNARGDSGEDFHRTDYNFGGSVIWLTSNTFNVLLEAVYYNTQSADVDGRKHRESAIYISPGIRGAFNLASGMQIVPGLAVPIGVGAGSDDYSIFAYLSFEHPF
jgi:hypothetical protein